MNRATEFRFIAETRSGKLEICRVSNLIDLAYAHALQGLNRMCLESYLLERHEIEELRNCGFTVFYRSLLTIEQLIIEW